MAKIQRARALAAKGALSSADMQVLERILNGSPSTIPPAASKGHSKAPSSVWPDDGSSTDSFGSDGDTGEVEVSDQMISAGVECLNDNQFDMAAEELVAHIFRAMTEASTGADDGEVFE